MESPSSVRPAARISTTTQCPSLPAELWKIIFSVGYYHEEDGSFWSHYKPPDLASICRSCTLFCGLARPMLYHEFDSHVLTCINYDDNNEFNRFSIVKFAWTISTNPLLASMVRRVNIEGVCDVWDMGMASGSPVPSKDHPNHPMASILADRAAELSVDFSYYEVYTNVHSPQNVGFDLVALILVQLPMLDTLSLKWSGRPPVTRMPDPRGAWPWKQSIRNMHLTYSRTSDPTKFRIIGRERRIPGYCLDPVIPLFISGTTLTRLTLECSAGPSFVPPLDNLREVIIIDCDFRPGQFLNLLDTCKSLVKFAGRRFKLSWGSEVMEALEPASSSLEVLGLRFSGIDFFRGQGPRIPSFRQFTALKTFSLDMNCVWDWQVVLNGDTSPNPDTLLTTLLPESIEEVALLNEGLDNRFRFQFEAHVKRLGLEITLNGRFQHLRRLHGVEFTPIDFNLQRDINDALFEGDRDGAREIQNHAARRFATLNEARNLMIDAGVEFCIDCPKELECDCENDPLILGHGI
ncbi:hypothetical protein KVR01_011488 [Diaporthe batatas]|uniref:uncharacterized protein n=1 Tax=Diaporthe batatas TaxID=748121 RepID=UPI001D0480FC|nr:uncharacterized protein KVR01_011488 [Diaporthe batatas]KAG8159045.1 hypothetical protein KVR01_011488 [Diaporthe batatas]